MIFFGRGVDIIQRDDIRKLSYYFIDYILNYVAYKGNSLKSTLHTKDYNQPALNFYEKFGFKIIESFEKYYRSGDNSYLLEMEI